MATGRPSIYTQSLADKICQELSMGKSMRTVCKPASMPNPATIFRWLRTKPEFCNQYEKAKQEAADAMVDDMLDIADDLDENPQSRRIRVDTRKWIASKLKPRKYGDKITHGGDPDNPIHVALPFDFSDPKSSS